MVMYASSADRNRWRKEWNLIRNPRIADASGFAALPGAVVYSASRGTAQALVLPSSREESRGVTGEGRVVPKNHPPVKRPPPSRPPSARESAPGCSRVVEDITIRNMITRGTGCLPSPRPDLDAMSEGIRVPPAHASSAVLRIRGGGPGGGFGWKRCTLGRAGHR